MARRPRILIVDADQQVRSSCTGLLAPVAETLVLDDSSKTPDCCRSFLPDLCLVEIVMEAKDGIECLLQMKQLFPQMPVIAMSGGSASLPRDMVLHWASGLGASAVLAKPLSLPDLMETVQRLLLPAKQGGHGL